MKVQFNQWNCQVVFGKYQNGETAIQLIDAEDGCPVATATVWIPNLKTDEIAVKDYSENSGMLKTLIDAGIVTEPHRHERSDYVSIPVCKLVKREASA
ncbi:hypothetical protein SRRS_06870 [Sporomusa rhizae]|uniref:hypothetical protein n=1 Tax=Sporomusa rhizae TaxID=357999 RepID=UPI00352AC364